MKVTIDNFLGGKIQLKQSVLGYRATSDSVLLASAVLAKDGQSVLDVGCASGIVSFCLNARIENLKITGVDVQEDLIALAKEINCFCPKESLLPPSPTSLLYPFSSFIINSSACAIFAASKTCSSVAFKFP